jgi:hypothetical protein
LAKTSGVEWIAGARISTSSGCGGVWLGKGDNGDSCSLRSAERERVLILFRLFLILLSLFQVRFFGVELLVRKVPYS